jgi:hypothetical protein
VNRDGPQPALASAGGDPRAAMCKRTNFWSNRRLPCRNASFFEFSLCLSRACLGEMIILTFKWRKKWRFLTCAVLLRFATLPSVDLFRPVRTAR